MKYYHVVSYKELPDKLRINGLPCKCKPGACYGPRSEEQFIWEVWDYIYKCYGSYPMAEELREHGPWLSKTKPFLVDVEKTVFSKLIKEGKIRFEEELLPKDILIEGHKFNRVFDRYYLREVLKQKEIRFVFDYMAPTYEKDINYGMNLKVNKQILESIASFKPSIFLGEGSVKILDYGVGTGICANAKPDIDKDKLSRLQIFGLDISKEMIKQAQQKKRSDKNCDSILTGAYEIKERRDGAHLLFPDKFFHAAMACFAVQYFLDVRPYREIYRLLKDGSPFVCNVLENEINRVESQAEKGGLILQKDHRQQLEYKVRTQPVFLLEFIKKER
jgi:ubiquinone/menaquinone biosynthesis C-methylase UbiE